MKARIEREIEALKQLASTAPEDQIAQASIAGQINALIWTLAICG